MELLSIIVDVEIEIKQISLGWVGSSKMFFACTYVFVVYVDTSMRFIKCG